MYISYKEVYIFIIFYMRKKYYNRVIMVIDKMRDFNRLFFHM